MVHFRFSRELLDLVTNYWYSVIHSLMPRPHLFLEVGLVNNISIFLVVLSQHVT